MNVCEWCMNGFCLASECHGWMHCCEGNKFVQCSAMSAYSFKSENKVSVSLTVIFVLWNESVRVLTENMIAQN